MTLFLVVVCLLLVAALCRVSWGMGKEYGEDLGRKECGRAFDRGVSVGRDQARTE